MNGYKLYQLGQRANMSRQQSTITSFFRRSEGAANRTSSSSNSHYHIDNLNASKIEYNKTCENNSPNKESVNHRASPNKSEDEYTPIKKPKISEDQNQNNSETTGMIVSPVTKERMKQNQMKAKVLLSNELIGALHIGIGHSWFDALEEEFKKPYFRALNDYLQKVWWSACKGNREHQTFYKLN